MFSDKQRSYAPYRYGGVWYVARVADGYRAYRTIKAATRNTIDTQVHTLSWGVLQN